MADSSFSSGMASADAAKHRTVLILDNGIRMRDEAGSSFSAGPLGFALQKTILTECNAAMLDYVRIFSSLRLANQRLCVLKAGETTEKVTSWQAEDQSLQAVVDGLANHGTSSIPLKGDIRGSLRAAMEMLLNSQDSDNCEHANERDQSAGSAITLERLSSRISRVSQGSQGSSHLNRALEGCGLRDESDSGSNEQHERRGNSDDTNRSGGTAEGTESEDLSFAGEAESVKGRIILIQAHEESLTAESVSTLLTERRGTSTSSFSCEVIVLSVLSASEGKDALRPMGDPANTQEEEVALEEGNAFGEIEVAASADVTVKKITLAAKDVAPCLRTMLHLHLDLCTINIGTATQDKEKDMKGAVNIMVRRDNDLSPTFGERHRSPSSSESCADEKGIQKKTRLIHLTLASKSGGNTSNLVPILPCAVSHASVPERPLAMATRDLVNHLVGGGLAILSNPSFQFPTRRVAGNSKRPLPATHMLTWQDGRLWLHQLQGATWFGWGEEEVLKSGDRARTSKLHDALSLTRQGSTSARKRGRDAPPLFESLPPPYPHLSVSIPDRNPPSLSRTESSKQAKAAVFPLKPLVIPNPSSLVTEAQSILGSPAQQSAELAALLRPITRAFLGDDLDRDKAARAEKCVRKLWDCTEANEAKLLPRLAESPKARQEVYRALWRELWEMSRLFRNTSEAHRQLALAIDFRQGPEKLHQSGPQLSLSKPSIERFKGHAHINKRRRCEEVPRDASGFPLLPIKVGPSLTILSLGQIVAERQAFHSDKYLWPVGYKSMRSYASMRHPGKRIQYCCEILDGGAAPEFRLTPEDDPSEPIVGVSATAVWTTVVKQVTMIRMDEGGKKTFANVSGPEYFGFANPTVARLLQELPGAAKCEKYRMQHYEPNVPMRNHADGTSPASTTNSSTSYRRMDSFGTSPLDDDVSISGWEQLASDLGEDGSDMGLDLSPSSFPGLTPEEVSAWMHSETAVKSEKPPRGSSTWTGLVTGAASEGGNPAFMGSKGQPPFSGRHLPWSGGGLGLTNAASSEQEPLDELWLLTATEEANEGLTQGDGVSWSALFGAMPKSN